VLSVGDEAFRRKSSARMRAFHESGATILLVSHDMDTVRMMCERAAWLDHGRLRAVGPVDDVVAQYHQDSLERGPAD
jgi:ABC-type polysaccharide/polyol phosphate transport system ATPase subunit